MKIFTSFTLIILCLACTCFDLGDTKHKDKHKKKDKHKNKDDKSYDTHSPDNEHETETCFESRTMNKDHIKPFGSTCFYFATEQTLDYFHAKEFCKNIGGSLAVLNSNSAEFVKKELHRSFKTKDYLWIGQTSSEHERYTRWNRWGRDEDDEKCSAISGQNGKWGHYPCRSRYYSNSRKPFICQYAKQSDSFKPTHVPPNHNTMQTTKVDPRTTLKPVVNTVVDACPKNLPRDKNLNVFGNSCFRFIEDVKNNRRDAEMVCKRLGGSLAMVKSKAINDFIAHELSRGSKSRESYWIGLQNMEVDNYNNDNNDYTYYNNYYNRYDNNYKNKLVYKWDDGTTMKYQNFDDQQQPRYSSKSCVLMSASTGKWHKYPCQNAVYYRKTGHPFICQFPTTTTIHLPTTIASYQSTRIPNHHIQPTKPSPKRNPTVIPTTAVTVSACPKNLPRDEYLKVFRNSCYRFMMDKKKNQPDADAGCKRLGGSLALVKSKAINDFIAHELSRGSKSRESYWIGLQNMEVDNYNNDNNDHTYYNNYYNRYDNNYKNKLVYKWDDGTTIKYQNFDYQQQPRYSSKSCVLMSASTGKWRKYPCQNAVYYRNTGHPFICQFPTISNTIPTKPKTRPTIVPTTKTPPTKIPTTQLPTTIASSQLTRIPNHHIQPTPKRNPTVIPPTVSACPKNLPRDKYLKVFRNSCYRFIMDKKKLQPDADVGCKRLGGSLAMVKSSELNDFITQEAKTGLQGWNYFWIGLQKMENDKNGQTYRWSDKTTLKYSNFAQQNSWYAYKKCVLFSSATGKWRRAPCQNPAYIWNAGYPYICQFPIMPNQVPTPLIRSTTIPTTNIQTTISTTKIPTTIPTTQIPTSIPTTQIPTTIPTTQMPTTIPTTRIPTTVTTTRMPTTIPTTQIPTTIQTTQMSTTIPTTQTPTTIPTTQPPTTILKTQIPTTIPTTEIPTTIPTTQTRTTIPTTKTPTTILNTQIPTSIPTTQTPTTILTTQLPTTIPMTEIPTTFPTTQIPTTIPTTQQPTTIPTTQIPTTISTTRIPTTILTTELPTTIPTTEIPTTFPTTQMPTTIPTTQKPTTIPTTRIPTTIPTQTSKPTTKPQKSTSASQKSITTPTTIHTLQPQIIKPTYAIISVVTFGENDPNMYN